MFGKIIFLRSIGVNLVLVYVGVLVCVKSFDVICMVIFIFMRI